MQNGWFTYGFLGLTVVSLITLAVFQYEWLGSVSEAERQRLEEGLEASSENFVSDFNEVFSNLRNNFRIQITDEETDITPNLAESYLRWYNSFDHSEILEEVVFVKVSEGESAQYSTFDANSGNLTPTIPDSATEAWVNEHANIIGDKPSVSLNALPDFGEHSFIDIPIQVLDFITLNRNEGIENLEVQLSINRLNDLVLIKLNNQYIKSTLIPEIASRYYGDSYDDQYHLAILKEGEQSQIYYNSYTNGVPTKPEMKVRLDRLNFSSMIMLDEFTGSDLSVDDGDSVKFRYVESNSSTRTNTIQHIAQFESNSIHQIEEEEQLDTVFGMRARIDTSIATAFVGNLSPDSWELWLSFKAGSLDALVSQTRNKNLAISFGILFILGFSCVLIVVFAQRSRQLADQQMMFVAGVSHELRTPLTVIRSAAENLSEGIVQDQERTKQYANLMLKEGRRLSDMVDQIMEYSGIQTGKRIYTFSDIDIEALMLEIITEFKPLFEEYNVKLEYVNTAKLNSIKADKDALFIAVTNLLNNAIKFGNDSHRVILRLDESNYKSGLALRIHVQDFGIGIPEDEQNDVFNPFYRGRSSVENQVKGNGIGLSMVLKIAHSHSGEIRLTSKENEGSTFTIIIPYHE